MWFKSLVSITCLVIVTALAYFVFMDWWDRQSMGHARANAQDTQIETGERREQCLSALQQYTAGEHDTFRSEVMDCTAEGTLTEDDYDALETELSGASD